MTAPVVTNQGYENQSIPIEALENSEITINGTPVPLGGSITVGGGGTIPTLSPGQIIVGDASSANVAATVSGDATLDDTGALTVMKSGGTVFGSAAFSSNAAFDAAGAAAAAQSAAESYAAGITPVAANPSATAKDTAVNGTATTFMRSDAAPAVQKASLSQFGIVEVDGTTITASSGVISATPTAGAGSPAQSANLVLAGPTSGGAASPTFRALVSADLPLATASLKGAIPLYATGTWNPTIVAYPGSGTNPTVTYNTQAGTWTLIGNRVFFEVLVDIDTISGGSGVVGIAGFPYAAIGVSTFSAIFTGVTFPSGTILAYADSANGKTIFGPGTVSSLGVAAGLAMSALSAGSLITMSGSYPIS